LKCFGLSGIYCKKTAKAGSNLGKNLLHGKDRDRKQPQQKFTVRKRQNQTQPQWEFTAGERQKLETA
jgi:hypothetical protein